MMTDVASTLDFDLGYGGDAAFSFDESVAAGFTAINTGAASSVQTVSPKDIFNDGGFGSQPPSTAFTNLTSPDINESPFMDSTYETSPMFDNLDFTGGEAWPSLFPDATDSFSTQASSLAPPMRRNESTNTLGSSDSSAASPLVSVPTGASHHRRKSSLQQGASPLVLTQASRPLSSSAGVSRRRRQKVLPAIEVDPNDKVAFKRARNTLAARDSRQRKLEHVSSLESRIAALEEQQKQMQDELRNRGYDGPLLEEGE